MKTRPFLLALFLSAGLAVTAAPALASLGDEVAAGRALAAQLQAGTTSCGKLSDSDFEHLGDYVMERMVGSRSAHAAMNDRMEAMMGTANADRMHQALGRRFAGCGGSAGTVMGGGMMGGASGGSGGWGAMMGSSDWSWMRNGNWQHMTRTQWQRAGATAMGPGMMSGTNGGWSTAAILAVVFGAVLLGGLAVFLVTRRPQREHPSGPAPA